MAQNVTNVSQTEEVSSTRRVIAASSVGTLIEWYDFYIFGTLAKIISEQFFPKDNPTAALLATLATFAAGFVIRPFGALFFGRLGDLIGRKYTFLVTLVIMGGSTFAIGLVPGYKTIGFLLRQLSSFYDSCRVLLLEVSMAVRPLMSPNTLQPGNGASGPALFRQRQPWAFFWRSVSFLLSARRLALKLSLTGDGAFPLSFHRSWLEFRSLSA